MADTIVRAIYDKDILKEVDGVTIVDCEAGDWVFGLGSQNYKTKVQMVAQRIASRLFLRLRVWYTLAKFIGKLQNPETNCKTRD